MKSENLCEAGKRIKLIREELKLKGKEFAKRLKISGPTVSEVEKGKIKPGYDLLRKLAKEFDINIYYVLFGEGDMFIDPVESYFNRAMQYAVNVDDVREFLHNFAGSPILQYHMMGEYHNKMMDDSDNVLKQVEKAESKLKR